MCGGDGGIFLAYKLPYILKLKLGTACENGDASSLIQRSAVVGLTATLETFPGKQTLPSLN